MKLAPCHNLWRDVQASAVEDSPPQTLRQHSVESIWINIRCNYPTIAKKALKILLQFSTSYLCEFEFSALTNIKKKKRSRLLNVDDEMRMAFIILMTKYKRNYQKSSSSNFALKVFL